MSKTVSLHKQNKELTAEQISKLMKQLRQMVLDKCQPLPDEPDYPTSDDTLSRFLKARKYVVKDAFKLLSGAIEWRRSFRPTHVPCTFCIERPGFHGIRQIGFDAGQRPVLYACFAQCQALKYTAEDNIMHVVYLVENALKCLEKGRQQWVIVIDCTGMTLPCCNPKLGKQFCQTFGDNYPEHLSRFFMVNHNPALHGVWKAIRVFVDPITRKKVIFVKKGQIEKVFDEYFGPETSAWLQEEIRLNKMDISEAQRRFWEAPTRPGVHDPRGTSTYVQKYIEPMEKRRQQNATELISLSSLGHQTHMPHPNIVQQLNGQLKNVVLIDLKKHKKHPLSKEELDEYGVTLPDNTDFSEDGEIDTEDETDFKVEGAKGLSL
ncbi:hypothetical protein EG68_07128 [Paragonimus skrjabini miyazakii]|uniref:CRAL-TRIO domain-containing protein n=1 Tax=Paragonimus skrjabini miyazakii TaxID=59628 RepID=A0A8S9YXD0_9TREM|nr:hypothetical protein EG68_07128 [Paragonimus skrjabini miyazakii]